MAKLQSINDLAHYCLRNLGGGINDIEVTEEQLQDRLEEAIDFFLERHFDGTEEVWFTHKVTADDVSQGSIQMPDTFKCVLDVQMGDVQFSPYGVNVPGIGVVSYNLQPIDFATTDMGYGNLAGYYISKSYITLMNDLLRPTPWISFNHVTRKLCLPGSHLALDSVYVIHGYRDIDVDESINVYNDKFIKQYATALIKRQWGANLKKYNGVELPGGVTIDGQRIYEEAISEIDKIEQDFEERYETQACLMIG